MQATIPEDFNDFKHCIPCSDVDISNDEFLIQMASGGDAVSEFHNLDGDHSPSLALITYIYFEVCLATLLFDGEQVTVYDGKDVSDQKVWIDNTHGRCNDVDYELSYIKIKNGEVSTACDNGKK